MEMPSANAILEPFTLMAMAFAKIITKRRVGFEPLRNKVFLPPRTNSHFCISREKA
jgi:hypothetical protein